jgi:hypothetical protein
MDVLCLPIYRRREDLVDSESFHGVQFDHTYECPMLAYI